MLVTGKLRLVCMDQAGIHAQREKPDITRYSKMIKILKNNAIKASIESILNSALSCCSRKASRESGTYDG